MTYGRGPADWAYVGHCHHYWHHHWPHHCYHWGPWTEAYWWPSQAPTKDQEIATLKEQARLLDADLTEIRKRLEELEK